MRDQARAQASVNIGPAPVWGPWQTELAHSCSVSAPSVPTRVDEDGLRAEESLSPTESAALKRQGAYSLASSGKDGIPNRR